MKYRLQRLKPILTVMAIPFTVVFFIIASQTTVYAVQPQVTAGDWHTVGVKSDGTVVAVGRNGFGQCNVSSWTDIVQVAGGSIYTVGLKSDGTVVAVGCVSPYNYGQCNVGSWTDIVQVAACSYHTVGLKSDGTVVAVGYNSYDGRCNVSSWTDIVHVAAGDSHSVGVKSDGTVVAVGWNDYFQCDVSSWTNIVQVAGGGFHTVGVKSDGTVVAVGLNYYGQLNVSSWTGIVQVAAGYHHTVGLKSDGTVVAVGWNIDDQCNVSSWTDIVQMAADWYHTVGLKSDGTVVAVGRNDSGQCNVYIWNLNEYPGVPVAGFSADPVSGTAPLTVNFTDKSTGDITDWLWDFGDGGSSTKQNPTHNFIEEGLYTVTLEVSGPEGLDTKIKTDYIAVYEEIALLTPNDGEIIPSGSGYTIEWDAPFIADNFKLRLSTDNGKAWETIDKGITDTSYEWDVPTPTKNKTNCLIKVVGYDASGVKVGAGKSEAPFTIAVLTVTSPNGGEVVPSGDTYDIEWETNGTESEVDSVELFYSRDGGDDWKLIETLQVNSGTYEWTVPAQKKNLKNCLVKVKALDASGNKVAVDKSDAPFTIAVLEVTSPNGEETLTSGDTHTITWTTNETKAEVAKVKLLYTKNGGDRWIKIDALTGGDPGTYDWLVPPVNKVKTECRVKVELKDAEGNIMGKATSDSYFTIEPLI